MSGFIYLAVVLNVFSRKIIGWSMQTHLRTELILIALDMAVGQRKPKDVIHHSDQGCRYTSLAFGNRCKETGVRPSMGSVGDAYEKAVAESVFSTLECELPSRRSFNSQAEARMARFTDIEGFLQSAAPALGPRQSISHRLRKELPSQPNQPYDDPTRTSLLTVHETGAIPAPELNPVENVWQYLRQNKLANRLYDSYEAIVNACCDAWNGFASAPDLIRSITTRTSAQAS